MDDWTRDELCRERFWAELVGWARDEDFLARLDQCLQPIGMALPLAGKDSPRGQKRPNDKTAEELYDAVHAEAAAATGPGDWDVLVPDVQGEILGILAHQAATNPAIRVQLTLFAQVSRGAHQMVTGRASVDEGPASRASFQRLLDAVALNSPSVVRFLFEEGTGGGFNILALSKDEQAQLASAIARHDAHLVLEQCVLQAVPYRPATAGFYKEFFYMLLTMLLPCVAARRGQWARSRLVRLLEAWETKHAQRLNELFFRSVRHDNLGIVHDINGRNIAFSHFFLFGLDRLGLNVDNLPSSMTWYSRAALFLIGRRWATKAYIPVPLLVWLHERALLNINSAIYETLVLDDTAILDYLHNTRSVPFPWGSDHVVESCFEQRIPSVRRGGHPERVIQWLADHVDAALRPRVVSYFAKNFIRSQEEDLTPNVAAVVATLLQTWNVPLGLDVYETWGFQYYDVDSDVARQCLLTLLDAELVRTTGDMRLWSTFMVGRRELVEDHDPPDNDPRVLWPYEAAELAAFLRTSRGLRLPAVTKEKLRKTVGTFLDAAAVTDELRDAYADLLANKR